MSCSSPSFRFGKRNGVNSFVGLSRQDDARPMRWLGLVVVLVASAIVGLSLTFLVGLPLYHRALSLDAHLRQQWSVVDSQLSHRWELIGAMKLTVEKVAGPQPAITQEIVQSRRAYANADTVSERALAAGRVESAVARLVRVQDTAPQLKSDKTFIALQNALDQTESELFLERARYNDQVTQLVHFNRQFPNDYFSRLAGVGRADYFKIDQGASDKSRIDFSHHAPNSVPTDSSTTRH